MSKLTIKTDLKVNHVPNGYITHFDGTKTFNSIEEAEELNYYDVKGALLSYDGSKYTAWNGGENLDSRAWDYRVSRRDYASDLSDSDGYLFTGTWDENVVFPDTYGDVIAVCVGNGLWMSTKWNPTNDGSGYIWCAENSPIYSPQLDCILGTGWENTSKLVERCQEGDLFAYVRDFGADDGTKGHWYVPSKFEIIRAINNLGEIFENPDPEYVEVSCHFLNNISNAVYQIYGDYWTSSQWPYLSSNESYILGSANFLSDDGKAAAYHCTVLLRFGEKLYQPQNQ